MKSCCFEIIPWCPACEDKFDLDSSKTVAHEVKYMDCPKCGVLLRLDSEIIFSVSVSHKDFKRIYRMNPPAHLFAGTPSQNSRDGHNKGRFPSRIKTHCLRGHEKTPENTHYSGPDNKNRSCKLCKKK